MKKFKKYITEAPFNIEDSEWSAEASKIKAKPNDKEDYDDPRDPIQKDPRVDFRSMNQTFKEKYKCVGEGSSRLAVKADISSNVFMVKDLKMLVQKGQRKPKTIETVFKLAMNRKGIVQNRLELKIWNDVKGTEFAQFLAPIIDWAGNPAYNNHIHYEINDTLTSVNGIRTAPFWLQMPMVKLYDYDDRTSRNALFENYFGFDGWPLYSEDYVQGKFYDGAITKQQLERCLAFIRFNDTYDVGDLHSGNFGGYQGRPVILDYGFDSETSQMYWGRKQDVEVTVNNKGEIEIHWD